MGGSILFTILFSVGGGLPVFTLAWIGNRWCNHRAGRAW